MTFTYTRDRESLLVSEVPTDMDGSRHFSVTVLASGVQRGEFHVTFHSSDGESAALFEPAWGDTGVPGNEKITETTKNTLVAEFMSAVLGTCDVTLVCLKGSIVANTHKTVQTFAAALVKRGVGINAFRDGDMISFTTHAAAVRMVLLGMASWPQKKPVHVIRDGEDTARAAFVDGTNRGDLCDLLGRRACFLLHPELWVKQHNPYSTTLAAEDNYVFRLPLGKKRS